MSGIVIHQCQLTIDGRFAILTNMALFDANRSLTVIVPKRKRANNSLARGKNGSRYEPLSPELEDANGGLRSKVKDRTRELLTNQTGINGNLVTTMANVMCVCVCMVGTVTESIYHYALAMAMDGQGVQSIQ